MAERLADETLAQILDQVLAVDDGDFSSCAPHSPFGNRQWSSANTLFVCKRWMRVGTPALYHTIILRSNPQAQSLMRALKKNRFGGYIRKLRLEGWFGTALPMIFKASINMTDICFQTSVAHNDNIDSFCSSIGSVSAQRVIIWNNQQSYSRQCVRVRESVYNWLQSLTTPIHLVARGAIMEDTVLCSAVEDSTITHLTLCMAHYYSMYGTTAMFRCLGKILPRTHFRQVRLDYVGQTVGQTVLLIKDDAMQRIIKRTQDNISEQGLSQYESKIQLRFESYPLAASWASLSEHQGRLVARSSNATPCVPDEIRSSVMQGRPRSLQVAIWAMILRYIVEGVFSRRSQHVAPYIKVCRAFKAAGLRVMHEQLHLWSNAAVQHAIYSDTPANYVLSISNGHYASLRTYIYTPLWFRFDDTFFTRCTTFNYLQSLQVHHFPISQLQRLASTVGNVICRLDIGIDCSVFASDHPLVLRFASLQRLSLTSPFGQRHYEWRGRELSWDLPRLERLEIWDAEDRFLYGFIQSTLPRILHLGLESPSSELPASFLALHGSKLQTLEIKFDLASLALNACPNLVTLTCIPIHDILTQPLGTLAPAAPIHSLLEIKLPIRMGGVRYKLRDSMTSRRRVWSNVLESLDNCNNIFPALKVVTMGNYVWPVDASDIKNSVEIIIAEELMERGLRVVDSNGNQWRPRLRTGGLGGGRKRKAARLAISGA